MKRTDERHGRRLPDVDARDGATNIIPRLEPGDYVRVLNFPGTPPPSNLTGDTWYVKTPNGMSGNLHAHTVREEDDGSITVKPGDGSSNSILINSHKGTSWHGYITRGLWWSLEPHNAEGGE